MTYAGAEHDEVRARVLDEVSEAILVADDDRRYVDVNDAACALFRRSRKDLLTLRVDDVMPHAPGVDVERIWLDFLAQGTMSGRFPFDRNGEQIIVEYRARARIARGHHVSILHDVTQRVRAEETLTAREAHFAQLADETPRFVVRFDRHYRVVFANRALTTLLGRPAAALLGKTTEELGLPIEIAREWNERLRRAFAGEEMRAELVVEDASHGEQAFDGRLFAERDRDGAIETVLAVMNGVPQRERTLVRIGPGHDSTEEANAILEALLATAPVGFAFLDRELRFRAINPALADMNGIPAAKHIGRTPMDLLPGISAEFVKTHGAAVLSTGKPILNLELRGETPKDPGVVHTWIEHWYPVRFDREVIGVGMVVEDVTDARRADAAIREAGELRERLLAIVSHDLRNPLGAITIAATVIDGTADAPPEVTGMARRILRMTTRMTALIEQLLDFVRIDQGGGLVLERTPMDLARAAAHAGEECALAHPKATVNVIPEGDTVGSWDEDRMLQVLSNLVFNAVQHGTGQVDVRVDGRAPAMVRLDVENPGRPISEELLPAIFDPFRRASTGYARRTGLGLGLYISKSIVEAHGGTITVRSGGTGTVFTIELPRRG